MKKTLFISMLILIFLTKTYGQVVYWPEDDWWSCSARAEASNWNQLGTTFSSAYSANNVQIYISGNFLAECSYETYAPANGGGQAIANKLNSSKTKVNANIALLPPPATSWSSVNISGSWTTNDNVTGDISLSYYNSGEGMQYSSSNTTGTASEYITLTYSVSAQACTASFDSAPNYSWAWAMLDFIW